MTYKEITYNVNGEYYNSAHSVYPLLVKRLSDVLEVPLAVVRSALSSIAICGRCPDLGQLTPNEISILTEFHEFHLYVLKREVEDGGILSGYTTKVWTTTNLNTGGSCTWVDLVI
jgi:hypothetical protein